MRSRRRTLAVLFSSALTACGAMGGTAEDSAPDPTTTSTTEALSASGREALSSSAPTAGAAPSAADSSSASFDPAPTTKNPPTACASTLKVASGDSFEQIARRCYGSRSYADWVAAHAHLGRGLHAGDKLDLPSFETLVTERLAAKWQSEAPSIAEAYSQFRRAESEIDGQLGGAAPGMAPYHPSPAAKTALESAVKATGAVAKRLEAASVRTKKFRQLTETLTRMASGTGNLSTDYATEEVHQSFYYGVEALH